MAKKPTNPDSESQPLTAYTVRTYKRNGKTFEDWMRIGIAFPHDDKDGFNAFLHALPIDGKIVFRISKPKEDAPDAPQE